MQAKRGFCKNSGCGFRCAFLRYWSSRPRERRQLGIRVGPEYILACKSQKTYLRIGSSGNPSEKFYGVGIGPLSKILAVKRSFIATT